jgi:hypothetical protein
MKTAITISLSELAATAFVVGLRVTPASRPLATSMGEVALTLLYARIATSAQTPDGRTPGPDEQGPEDGQEHPAPHAFRRWMLRTVAGQ